ncbi:MAG: hypothetical protein WDZ73_00720 [Candidatus Paceibacterota bacterium]
MDNYNNHNQNMQPSNNQNNSSSNGDKWGINLTIAIVAIVVGLLLGYAVFGNKLIDGDTTPNNETGTSTTDTTLDISQTTEETTATKAKTTTPTTEGNMLVITEDQPTSDRVNIKTLTLDEGAWVVTFNSTEDGQSPFKIIGAQYFDAGSYTNVTAYITEKLQTDQTYFVALYKDDGLVDPSGNNRHVFNHETDVAFVKNGGWIMDSFVVTTTATTE